MIIILFIIITILLVVLISTKLGLTAYIAWMEENHFRQPSDKDMQRLIAWCVKNCLNDINFSTNESRRINRKTSRNMIICIVCMFISIACLIIHIVQAVFL